MADATNQYDLPSPPSDAISSVHFSPTEPDKLLVTSWDSSLRLYSAPPNTTSFPPTLLHNYTPPTGPAPLLSASYASSTHAYTGSLDRRVRSYDLATGQMSVLGAHDDAVSCVSWCAEANVLLSASWDATLRLWDPRAPEAFVATVTQPAKAYSMDVVGSKVVLAMAERKVAVLDARYLGGGRAGGEGRQLRESSLKFMTRAVRCMPDGEGYATSSIEGRIAVEFFDPSPAVQAKKYAFKCHRVASPQGDVIYPVNALAFHPVHHTFASCGSDGLISIWDASAKKRLKQFGKYANAVQACAFNADGTLLAAGWSEGAEEEGKAWGNGVGVTVRCGVEGECKPRSKA